jgi:hypothetical protein
MIPTIRLVAAFSAFSLSVWVSQGQAANSSEEGVSTFQMQAPKEAPKSSYHWRTGGDLDVEATQYQSSIPDKPQLDHSLLVKAHLKPELSTDRSHSVFDFTAQKYTDWGLSDYSVRELYWSLGWRDEKSHFSLGRKIEFWSQVDHDWQLGMWQPKSVLDSLRPEEQGLTGVFYQHKEGRFEWLGLVSPIFIPTMGPEVKEEGGNIVSDSRWYRSPSPTFIIFNQKRRVVYSLNVPDYRELVFKPGFGTRLSYGRESGGFWASANLGYKPMNTLLVKYDKKLALSEEGEDTGSAPLFPAVAYHGLWGGDVGYRFQNAMIAFSYLEDRPFNKNPEDPYIVQYANPMKSYSVHADSDMKVPGFLNPVNLMAGYLRIDGGDYKDYDHDEQYQGAVFNQRFNFYNAALLQAQFTSSIARKKTVSRLSYMREFEQKGMIASASVDVYPIQTMALTLGADVLGVDDSGPDNHDPGFLNEFRANDRVYAGISYVF